MLGLTGVRCGISFGEVDNPHLAVSLIHNSHIGTAAIQRNNIPRLKLSLGRGGRGSGGGRAAREVLD
jgi:hypothetical protein